MQRVSAEVGNAHALLLDVNVTQMFAEIAGLGNEFHIFDVDTSLMWDWPFSIKHCELGLCLLKLFFIL